MRHQARSKSFLLSILAILLLTIFSLAGCDCVQSADGIILDKQTRTPLGGVSITTVDSSKNTIKGSVIYSGENGQFKFSKISGGIRQCPNLTLYFYKQGFKQNVLTFEPSSSNDTIYLDKY